jgi:hypothetical protein
MIRYVAISVRNEILFFTLNYFDYLSINHYTSFDSAYNYSRVDRRFFKCKINIENLKLVKSELDINDRGYKVYIVSDQWNGTCEYNYQADCICSKLTNGDIQMKLNIGIF